MSREIPGNIKELIRERITAGGYPFPPVLVDGLVWAESRGKVGLVNPVSNASGLMQCLSIAVRHYREKTGSTVRLRDLQGTDEESAKIQLDVGLWNLGWWWYRAATHFIPTYFPNRQIDVPDLARVADLFFRWGPGNVMPELRKIGTFHWPDVLERAPDSFLISRIKNVFGYAKEHGFTNEDFNEERIRNYIANYRASHVAPDVPITDPPEVAPPTPVGPPLIATKPTPKPIDGFLMGILLIALGAVFLKGKK